MKPNLWIYSTKEEINQTAASLIGFGAEVFHRARIIKDLDLFENLVNKLDRREIYPNNEDLNEFNFTFLADTVSILIFFENYMKAELLIRGFCVHNIKRGKPFIEFKEIADKQRTQPIMMEDINAIESFEVNVDEKEIFHRGIEETTIGMYVLIGSKEYLKNYQFNNEVLKFIKEMTVFRNRLHFYNSIEFTTSVQRIETLKKIKVFVKEIIEHRIKVN